MINTELRVNTEEHFSEKFRKNFQDKVNSFKTPSAAKNKFLQLTELSEKTWYRYLNNETAPCGHNIVKCYKFILDLEDDVSIIEKLPETVLEYYKKTIDVIDMKSKREKLANILNKSHVHTRLFFETMDGTYVNKMDFIESWGKTLTISAFKDLEEHKIISNVEGNFYRRGSVNSTFETSELIHLSKSLINEMSEDLLNDEIDGTFLTFDSFQLSESSLEKYSQLCMKHREELYDFANQNKGSIKVLTSLASMKLQKENM